MPIYKYSAVGISSKSNDNTNQVSTPVYKKSGDTIFNIGHLATDKSNRFYFLKFILLFIKVCILPVTLL